MMVKPTTAELLKKTDSKFRLVIATSKRARQIAEGQEKLTDVDEEAPVTIAANEIAEGKVKIEEQKNGSIGTFLIDLFFSSICV